MNDIIHEDPTLCTDPSQVTDKQFIKALFGNWAHVAQVASFREDPNNIPENHRGRCWTTDYYDPEHPLPAGDNTYFTISSFYPGEGGKVQRRKALHHKTAVVVLDDVHEKLSFAEVLKLPLPTYVLETSPGSEHWGYKLDQEDWNPYTVAQIENLQDGLIESDLCPAGRDPGLFGVTRFVRLPSGYNRKAKYVTPEHPEGYKCRLKDWHPERKVTLEALAKPFGIDLNAERKKTFDGEGCTDSDHPVLVVLSAAGVLGEALHGKPGCYNITCPWVHEHTGGADDGTAIQLYDNGNANWFCHHSCSDTYGFNDFKAYYRALPGWEDALKVFRDKQSEGAFEGIEGVGVQEVITEPITGELVGQEEAPTPSFSDADLADELGGNGYYTKVKHIPGLHAWYIWDGVRWCPDDKLKHLSMVGKFLKAKANKIINRVGASDEDIKAAKGLKAAARRASVMDMIRVNEKICVSPDYFDADLLTIGTPNGTLFLESGARVAADPSHNISKLTGATLEEGNPVEWLAFLNTIFAGDQETINFIQRLCGYALTGLSLEQKLFFLHGTGNNGKSVLLEILTFILGDYARKLPSSVLLEQRHDQHPTALAGLKGARIAIAGEIPKNRSWNEEVVKDMTGGEKLTARLMRQDYFDFIAQFTILIAGNNKPRLKSSDEAIRRRMVLIPFEVTIPKADRDKKLVARLKDNEAGQILNWCREGAILYFESGLQIPASIEAASKDYIDDEDVIADFIGECLVPLETGSIAFSEVYHVYHQWMINAGNRYTVTEKDLRKEFKARKEVLFKGHSELKLKGYCAARLNGAEVVWPGQNAAFSRVARESFQSEELSFL